MAAGAAVPFATRSIVYPICTKQSMETGITKKVISKSFLFTETSKEELVKREEMEKMGREAPRRPKFDHFSTRELYEQCRSEGITVPKGKSRNRKYLMNCLMGIHETKVYRYRSVLKEHRQRKVMDVIFAVFLLVMAVNYIRHGIYLFHLLFR